MATAVDTTDTAQQLEDVNREIAKLEGDLESINQQIGSAYARQRRGDKKVSSDLGKLSAKRSKAESSLSDLRLTQQALADDLAAWEAGGQQRRMDTAADTLDRLTQEARQLERQLGKQVIAVGETAQRLRQAE